VYNTLLAIVYYLANSSYLTIPSFCLYSCSCIIGPMMTYIRGRN